jgi:hypothetical protein
MNAELKLFSVHHSAFSISFILPILSILFESHLYILR